jgi:hypothetical protein
MPPLPAAAQRPAEPSSSLSTPQLDWQSEPGGVRLDWSIGGEAEESITAAAATAALAQLPLMEHAGYQLPLQLQLLRLPDEAPFTPAIEQVVTQPWSQAIPRAAPQTPAALDEDLVRIWPSEPAALPTTPLFVLREGRMRGQRLAVVAFSPLYQQADTTYLVTRLTAHLPGLLASPQALSVASLDAQRAQPASDAILAPTNPAAWQSAVKIHVRQPGIQRVAGADLLNAGLSAGTHLDVLHLAYWGQPVALEIRDADGRLDATTELRFYAPPSAHSNNVGDRWNDTVIYWLTVESVPGVRMTTRAMTPSTAPVRTTALETGVWEDNQLYESTMPGVDGDHWFAKALRSAPGPVNAATAQAAHAVVTLATRLPPADAVGETATITLTGSARTKDAHQIAVDIGASRAVFSWSSDNFYAPWQHTVVTTEPATTIDVQLIAGAAARDIRLDKIHWRQPVSLNFGGKGAHFQGVEGIWRYTLSGLPTTGSLYDVTDPAHPQLLAVPWGSTVTFADGPAARSYVLAGPGTVHTPTVSAYSPVTLPLSLDADVLYIAPAEFHAALAPLVAHRRALGYQVAVVDVQAAYDSWSFGQIAPEAIRSLLRYAVQHGSPAPIAAVLVGDGTIDPHNYFGYNNPNRIPPYLAYADPWLGQVACENCFAQLDGESPLDREADAGFLTDIWLGRLSVQNEEQLRQVVNKILYYETADALPAQTYTSLSVADNYIQPSGQKDAAGDFAYFQDLVVVGDPARQIPPLQSDRLPAMRLYYDPRPGGVTDPWREPDAVRARQRVIAAMQRGPRLVTYNGHANHFQWASTQRDLDEPYLFGTNDIYIMRNLDRLSIVLEMTCLTAQFVYPSATGTTIDEHFQRQPDGGAVAIWGSAGYTVAYGQQALLQGFHGRMWQEPVTPVRLGELIQAGYLALFANESCCQETHRVYLLLGDPLTPALIFPPADAPRTTYLPLVHR